MRFIKSALTTLIFKFIAMAAGLAVSIIIARVFGPEGRGVYALVMTMIVMSASFGVFGLTTANTFFAAKDVQMQRTIGSQSIIAGLVGGALSILVIYLMHKFSPTVFQGLNEAIMAITFAMIPLFLWGNLFAFAYLGRGRILAFNTFETAQRVIFCVLSVLVLWHWNQSIETYLTMVLIAIGLFTVIYIINYFRDVRPGPSYESGYTAKSFAYGIKSYVAILLTMAVVRSGVLFTNYFGGTKAAGLFAVAQQISELVVIIPTVVGAILFGRISKGDSYHLTPRVLRTITAIFLPISIVLFVASDVLINFVFGAEFINSATLLKIMLPGALFLGLEVIMAQDIAGRGYPWPAVLVWIPVLIINIAGYVVLIPAVGVNGAAISISVSYLAIFALITVYYLKLSGTAFTELFILKKEDVHILLEEFRSTISGNNLTPIEGKQGAIQTVPNQVEAEISKLGR